MAFAGSTCAMMASNTVPPPIPSEAVIIEVKKLVVMSRMTLSCVIPSGINHDKIGIDGSGFGKSLLFLSLRCFKSGVVFDLVGIVEAGLSLE